MIVETVCPECGEVWGCENGDEVICPECGCEECFQSGDPYDGDLDAFDFLEEKIWGK